MKDLIRKILRENIQQADKYYFNNQKLSPKVREIILKITNGDPYTKLVTDIYYNTLYQNHDMGNWALSHLDDKHQASEHPESDLLKIEDIRKIKDIYTELKNYNKNVFPIKGFNINGVENIPRFTQALKERKSIMDKLLTLPTVATRNLKNDIRQERDSGELQDYRSDLEYFLTQYSQLGNREPELRKNIENKMFKGDSSLQDWMNFADEKENLLGGGSFTKKEVKEIVNNSYDLEIIYSKGDKMIVEVTGADGIKEIGCNSLWCFTYAGKHGNHGDWYTYSTRDTAYVLIDFSEPSDSSEFMHVLIKPIPNLTGDESEDETLQQSTLYNMANEEQYDINRIIEYFLPIEKAQRLMNFGIEPEKKPRAKRKKYVDPNQLSFPFENKVFIKKLIREQIFNEYDDDDDDYDDDDGYDDNYDDDSDREQHFTKTLPDEIKQRSNRYIGRGVTWYGDPGRMIVIDAENVYGMFGNIYDDNKFDSVVNMISKSYENVEFECSYGLGSVVTFMIIKEEQQSEHSGNFETDYNGHDKPVSTGNSDLDDYVGTEDISDLPYFNSSISQERVLEFFEKYRFSLIEGNSTVETLNSIFQSLSPTEDEKDAYQVFIDLEENLVQAEENEYGDFGTFKVQLRDGHHRVMGAIEAGEKFVCMNLPEENIREFKGHYNLVTTKG